MGKKIYVNGGILVDTRYFCFANGATALQTEQPEDSVLLEPTGEIDGAKCLIIDDENPQSIFDTYYAKTFITSYYEGAEFLIRNYDECFNNTFEGLNEVRSILSSIQSLDQSVVSNLMKYTYINIITILDSFICSIILSTIIKDEKTFVSYYDKMLSNDDKVRIGRHLIEDHRGKWELEVIYKILRTPFENMKRIKDSFCAIGLSKPQDENGVMKEHFKKRNVLVHRNGKTKSGEVMIITKEDVTKLICDTTKFVERIRESLPQN